jgi:hypothetical protein
MRTMISHLCGLSPDATPTAAQLANLMSVHLATCALCCALVLTDRGPAVQVGCCGHCCGARRGLFRTCSCRAAYSRSSQQRRCSAAGRWPLVRCGGVSAAVFAVRMVRMAERADRSAVCAAAALRADARRWRMVCGRSVARAIRRRRHRTRAPRPVPMIATMRTTTMMMMVRDPIFLFARNKHRFFCRTPAMGGRTSDNGQGAKPKKAQHSTARRCIDTKMATGPFILPTRAHGPARQPPVKCSGR